MVASTSTSLRRVRERELVVATRALFDERGVLDAPIEEIARAVGIARGLVYRHFSSKEELFVLTVTDYLGELACELESAIDPAARPTDRLARCVEAYAGYCRRYPAFLDASLSLMHRSARDLQASVSESVWLRLGQGMARCLGQLAAILHAGREAGEFSLDDPDYAANLLWTQGLGAMHLARIGIGVRQAEPDVPGAFALRPERVVQSCVASALAIVGARPGGIDGGLMTDDGVPMTIGAHARLEEEVQRLEQVERTEVAERIRTAREWGDLKENGEYHAAKEAQAHLETRILVLRDRLRRAEIVSEASGQVVGMGSRVRVRDDTGGEREWTISASHEADASRGLLSSESPVGIALVGRRPGDEAQVQTPRGVRRLTVVSVTPT